MKKKICLVLAILGSGLHANDAKPVEAPADWNADVTAEFENLVEFDDVKMGFKVDVKNKTFGVKGNYDSWVDAAVTFGEEGHYVDGSVKFTNDDFSNETTASRVYKDSTVGYAYGFTNTTEGKFGDFGGKTVVTSDFGGVQKTSFQFKPSYKVNDVKVTGDVKVTTKSGKTFGEQFKDGGFYEGKVVGVEVAHKDSGVTGGVNVTMNGSVKTGEGEKTAFQKFSVETPVTYKPFNVTVTPSYTKVASNTKSFAENKTYGVKVKGTAGVFNGEASVNAADGKDETGKTVYTYTVPFKGTVKVNDEWKVNFGTINANDFDFFGTAQNNVNFDVVYASEPATVKVGFTANKTPVVSVRGTF